MNLHEYAKNQVFSSFCSKDMVNLKILQSDWSKALWPKSQEPDFSQVWDLCKNAANNIKFLYRPNFKKKLITKFSIKFKKLCFEPILSPFSQFWGAKKFFLENPAFSRTTSYEFLVPCQRVQKVNDIIQRRRPERRKDGRTERPYFIGPFRLPSGIQ